MTLKQENGIAVLLAALPVVFFLAVADSLSDRIYTHISGSGGIFLNKASFAKLIWIFGAMGYFACLTLKGQVLNRFPAAPATVYRFIASGLFSTAFVMLILSNRA